MSYLKLILNLDEFPKVSSDDWNAHVPNEYAAVALTKIFEKDRDITLVCIGPLTNVAMALKLRPEFAEWPKKIVIMGGNIHGM
jgi:inosine-uridine nucleoside N-ribohydrolase